MRCSWCEPLLDDFLEDALPSRQMREIAHHLRSCETCEVLMSELRVVDALLTTARSRASVAPDFTASVVSATRGSKPHRIRRFPLALPLLGYLAVAWALVALVAWRVPASANALGGIFNSGAQGLTAIDAALRAVAPASALVAAAVTGVLLIDLLLLAAVMIGYHRMRTLLVVALMVTGFGLLARPALADTQTVFHGGTYFGSVVVEPGQVVDGDLTVIFGDATIAGIVEGDLNVVGGNYDPRPGGVVTGQVNQVGGAVTQAVVPWAPADTEDNPLLPDHRLLWRISWNVLALLVFLIFPLRTRMVLDRLERHPGLSVVAGLIGCIAILPLAVLLAITILLIPLIVLEMVFVLASAFLGTAALALLIGRRLCELISPKTTPSPLLALVVGIVLITAAELVPVVGTLVLIFVGLIGLGATILSFAGESYGLPVAGRPISGPPMASG